MITVPPHLYDRLIRHAKTGHPDEVCGVLGGDRTGDVAHIKTLREATNTSAVPETEYAIAPEEQLQLIESIESDGHDVIGFYHSHPAGPPTPSATDADRATWPDLSYVIVILSCEHPFVGSWRWDDDTGRFDQEIVRLTA